MQPAKRLKGPRIHTRFLCIALAALLMGYPISAHAVCCDCGCDVPFSDMADQIDDIFQEETGATDPDNVDGDGNPTGRTPVHWRDEMQRFQLWFVNDYFFNWILPAMARMAEQLSAVGMYQIMTIGSMLDAKHQLETQRVFAALAAEAHKNYQPSDMLCTIGSSMRSLAASERNMEMNMLALGNVSMRRETLNVNMKSAAGPIQDMRSRLEQFRRVYCDPNDDNGGLAPVCAGGANDRKNKDVDFTRTIANPMTLDIDFSNPALTNDEEDVMALSANLFSHEVFRHIDRDVLNASEGNLQRYMDLRAIVAKRSVAEQSFNAITAMKSRGSTDAAQTATIGTNPSYYAQMEILTRKLFQNPDTISGLYETPVNVARRGIAARAFNLMQSQDMYESDLRTEAMLGVLLETELMKEQSAVQRLITPLVEGR
ncbi:MAG: hypothetical protein HYU57_08225 [Micavibrio aeruginosavorus]|nr:hypothetical protein [Micavibrio aeruginosavorus]